MRHPLFTMGVVVGSLEHEALSCDCDAERDRTRMEHFAISPTRGGGWSAWAEAFVRLIDRLIVQPAHCIVVSQEPNQRYVQLMVGHGHAHIEVSSNHYLMGDFRLDLREEALIQRLGFEPPDTAPSPSLPLNWWRNEERGADGEAITGRVLVALTTILGFDGRHEIAIHVFGAEYPCEACFWGECSGVAE